MNMENEKPDSNQELSQPKLSLKERWSSFRKRNVFVRILTNGFFIATAVFLVIVIFLDKNNLLRWGRDRMELHEQKRVIRQYRQDIKETEEKLRELSSNKDSLEKFAREQYYFQEEGEEVFIVK